jgi:predicted CXXCH cytochrome family protein
MRKKLYAAIFLAAAAALFAAPAWSADAPAQDDMAPFKDNSCVRCHSTEMRTSDLSNRYLEWHLSTHKLSAVACEKCHGGDPTTNNKGKSHVGMLAPSDPKSTANPANLPATCSACHQQVATAFTASKHFAAVKAAGGGPSCNACHDHMSSSVITIPAEGAALCAKCHTPGGATAASKHLEVPAKAEEVMASLERADAIQVWANGLLDAAKARKLDVAAEDKELQAVDAMIREAKASWHEFSLTGVREKADSAFERGTKAKDALRKKMGFN